MNIDIKRYPLYHECIVAKFPHHNHIKEHLLFLISETPSEFLQDGLLSDWNNRKNSYRNKHYMDFFLNHSKDFYNNILINIYKIPEPRAVNYKFWFQQYSQMGYHSLHFHGFSDYSSVYFVDLPKKDSTVFYNQFNNTYQRIDAEEGDIIFFPSFHLHTSLPSNKKTILALDFRVE